MTTGHSLESFVKDVLLDDLRKMVYDCGLHYLAFGTIAVGIEFLGACTDADPWNERGKSKKRFSAGIDTYMDKVDSLYAVFNADSSPYNLYRHLRCGMAHILKPQGGVGLTCRSDAASSGMNHLDEIHGGAAIVMTPEDFFDDFAKACGILLGDLPAKTESKFTDVYLPVTRVQGPGV